VCCGVCCNNDCTCTRFHCRFCDNRWI
jgi:hypothetical protein